MKQNSETGLEELQAELEAVEPDLERFMKEMEPELERFLAGFEFHTCSECGMLSVIESPAKTGKARVLSGGN